MKPCPLAGAMHDKHNPGHVDQARNKAAAHKNLDRVVEV